MIICFVKILCLFVVCSIFLAFFFCFFYLFIGRKCHSQKDFDKDDVLCPDSPNTCSEDVSSGGGRLKFFKGTYFITCVSY